MHVKCSVNVQALHPSDLERTAIAFLLEKNARWTPALRGNDLSNSLLTSCIKGIIESSILEVCLNVGLKKRISLLLLLLF